MDKLLISFFSFFFFLSPLIAEDLTYRLGFVVPLTGDLASIGIAVKHGFEIGLEKLSPEVKKQLEVYYEDDGFQARNALAAYNNLKVTKNINVLLSVSSGIGNALAPLPERDKITMISIASDPKVCAKRRYIFNLWTTPEEEVRVAFKEARRRGYKSVAIINTEQDGSLAISDAFVEANKNGDFKIGLVESFTSEAKDFKSFIIKLKQREAVDAILVTLLPGQPGLFAKQLRQLGVNAPLFGIDSFEDPSEVKLSEGALIGQWYVVNDEAQPDFLAEYQLKYPDSAIWGAANGHDIAKLIGEAITKHIAPRDFSQMLENLKDFKGALGVYSATGDHRFTLPAAVKVVTETGFEKVKL